MCFELLNDDFSVSVDIRRGPGVPSFADAACSQAVPCMGPLVFSATSLSPGSAQSIAASISVATK